jgi:gliding motility-associated-like protein
MNNNLFNTLCNKFRPLLKGSFSFPHPCILAFVDQAMKLSAGHTGTAGGRRTLMEGKIPSFNMSTNLIPGILRITYTFIASFLLLTSLQAKHIIGGVMTYECLGNDRYEFTLRVFRDNNCTDCADFDPVAAIGVYRCNNCTSESQNDPYLQINTPLLSNIDVDNPDYPCLIPPDVRVQEGLYRFELTLPQSDQSYHISYQRCCRNVTISNILFPENTGATYSIELTPEAQAVCNNTPVFNEFPPTIICVGTPLSFDHSATDADGDQLVYSFCSPLNGGGPILSGTAYNSCDGAQPIPACPPPYNQVTFFAPNYTFDEPMGGAPLVSIDPNTGIISGTPTVTGQFVVGVCVEEYRNGQLLSTVFRDFQFNVASCDPTVVAQVQADEVINGQDYFVVSCGNTTVPFTNESFQETFIDFYEWTFEIEGQDEKFDVWDPIVSFPDTGLYNGQLILNPNTDCGDTANIIVQIYPAIEADFSFEYDTCVSGPTLFTDASFSGSGTITDWLWNFGDTNTSTTQNPVHTYQIPGNLPVSLTVTDINGCVDTEVQTINYFPVPETIVVAPSSFIGCTPASIFFDNLSFPIDETYDILWDFGDGGTGTAISPTYLYETPGTYTVSLDIVSPIGCQTDTVFEDLITILPSPVAGFRYSPTEPSNIEPTVSFFDESQFAISWNYDFGEGLPAYVPNPVYTFRDTGLITVTQIVTHPSGCQDTAIQIIDIRPEVRYFLPNAFTPNEDSENDVFRGNGVMEGATNFELGIWNRWGELIFETNDPFEGWNGRKNNSGELLPNGVYMVLVTFNGPRGEPYEYRGVATLIR